ncbi:MAG: glycosyltransferase family 2 protein [Roseiarcus sp.]
MSLTAKVHRRGAMARRFVIRTWRFALRVSGVSALQAAYRRRYGKTHAAKCLEHMTALAAEEKRNRAPPAAEAEALIAFVVPVYNAKPDYLDDLIGSIRRQTPGACRLVLSDDGSTERRTRAWLSRHENDPGVSVVWNVANRGIATATNAGIARAEAPWIGLLDHDDALAPFAVARISRALAENPDCQFLYTDEVITDKNLRPVDFFLKPAWDPVLLSGVNYINHLSLYKRSRLMEIGGLRDGFQGSQDYDLLLRYTKGLSRNEIRHLPYPAYLWRRDGASHSVRFMEAATDNARRALAEHFSQTHRKIAVSGAVTPDLHRVRFDTRRQQWPLVSVVIPNRNSLALISRVLDGLTQGADYPNLEIIVVDNGTDDPAVLSLYRDWEKSSTPFRARIDLEPFNFSRSINRGVAMAKGALVLLLNNDIEIVERDWLKEMVSCFEFDDVGVVGAKLLYPDRTIQHVGVIAGLGGYAGHWFIGQDKDFPGPMGRLRVRQSLSVVTGACMLVSKDCWRSTGPLDEDVFPIAYNDVDFCLRALDKGFRVVWTPFATLIHHESATRGSDETRENIDRFNRDKANLRDRHRTDTYEDRYFSPWYSKRDSYPYPIFLDRLPPAR